MKCKGYHINPNQWTLIKVSPLHSFLLGLLGLASTLARSSIGGHPAVALVFWSHYFLPSMFLMLSSFLPPSPPFSSLLLPFFLPFFLPFSIRRKKACYYSSIYTWMRKYKGLGALKLSSGVLVTCPHAMTVATRRVFVSQIFCI